MDRSFGPDEIIFNVGAELEVSIAVEAVRQEVGDSEYEQLRALIAPVVERLPLADLSGEDVTFLLLELGLEQQLETRRRLEWLRRSAWLERQTRVAAECFYGWGRKHIPLAFDELSGLDPAGTAAVPGDVLAWTDDQLQAALREASVEKIIPARLGRGFPDIRALVESSLTRADSTGADDPCEPGAPESHRPRISGRLLDERTGTPLPRYGVQACRSPKPVWYSTRPDEWRSEAHRVDQRSGIVHMLRSLF